jgi:hypothetical protein
MNKLPSVIELMVEIKKYWTTASGEPELKEFAEYVQGVIQAHTAAQVAAAEKRGIEKAVVALSSVKTEGLFDNGDLFIKREPIDQEVINLVGYEKYKAIRESLPAAHVAVANADKPTTGQKEQVE